MSWMERFFGKKTTLNKIQNQDPDEDNISFVEKHMIRIRSRNFFGTYNRSPNGKYIIAWRDQDIDGNRQGGFRESGLGDYVLLEDGEAIAEGRLERPECGKTADNGTFILHDEHFGQNMAGTFFSFDKSGTELMRHSFSANLLNNGLSPDGRFVICQACNSDTDSGNGLVLFDLEDGEILWNIVPPSGWAKSYEFDVHEAIVYLIYKDEGRYAYSMADGDFMDWERWENDRIDHGSPYEQMQIAKQRLEILGSGMDPQSAGEIVFIIKKAIANGLTETPTEHGKALRMLGELWETLGDLEEALKCYEEAISIYPKVGVKGKIKNLRVRFNQVSDGF